MNNSKQNKANLSLDGLKGMQSVRATFTLPKQTINLLSAVANQIGVKQKSIFDHLVKNSAILDQTADDAQNYKPEQLQRKQKTFVLSRSSLNRLDSYAREYELPRDVLVEFFIKQLQPVVAEEKQKHVNRKILLKEMQDFRKLGSELMDRALQLIGEGDSLYQKLQYVFNQYERSIDELKDNIEKGKCMEEFE
jgi:hypothetical protein